jgi:sRNA-binding protein
MKGLGSRIEGLLGRPSGGVTARWTARAREVMAEAEAEVAARREAAQKPKSGPRGTDSKEE